MNHIRHLDTLVMNDYSEPSQEFLARNTQADYKAAEKAYMALQADDELDSIVMDYVTSAEQRACEMGMRFAFQTILEAGRDSA
jgi:hypothetical protein